ncbi:tRNA (guanine-N7-)-methyltransferase [Austwickia chelonae]|uniref:tRNA (guanine-N(7)-)-methyltransferase n=1 Tax=Austwickia chelonae NBRC 105200 TaxID=1184607 RepID=K6V5U4_9MICO|nr:tRNA (guanosine(46)-N7)-methyltransferase TrmB [Austwickia chelonae]GAB77578.1 tRNA (guanine-N(7)-)-methyltransferase [Austwickia chelonae NBRC 105200]SEW13317.1 tRNA (guanine-N7-)-methyltransferase [Austwickia chelonae]
MNNALAAGASSGSDMSEATTDASRLPYGLRREVVSFARRDGRIHPKIAKAWSAEHEALMVSPPRLDRDASLDPEWQLDAHSVFGRRAPLVVEIGSGTGEAVLASAAEHPELDHLAVEVYRPGAAKTAIRAHRRGLTNLRILQADAAALLRTGLEEASVSEVRIFFPDPWHKARHHKRRLVNENTVAGLARVLADGGRLRLATDWAEYAEQMLRVVSCCSELANPHDGFAPRWSGRPVTRFERKGSEAGRLVHDLELIRLQRN